MGYYRLFLRDEDGHFGLSAELEVPTDEDACLRARALEHAYSIEIWQQARLVAIVPAASTDALMATPIRSRPRTL